MHPTATGGELYRAGLPSLGARLLAAAGWVRQGSVAADIGCDHGKLAVYLVKSGRCRRVIATDVRPMPLARAKALVRQTGLEAGVDCRLGDGLSPISPGEVQDIVLAGMSGETMAAILDGVSWLRDPVLRLVLVPVTRAADLRGWLADSGFALEAEQAVEEAGRYYTVLRATYTGTSRRLAPLERELGLLAGQQGAAVQGYIRARLQDLKNKAKAPLTPQVRTALERLTEEVEACLP